MPCGVCTLCLGDPVLLCVRVIFVGLVFSWWEPGATCGLTKQSVDMGRAFLLFFIL